MSVSNPKLHVGIEEAEAKLDRFEGLAAAIICITVTLAIVTYLVLLQVLP